jgi:hypothetical protein
MSMSLLFLTLSFSSVCVPRHILISLLPSIFMPSAFSDLLILWVYAGTEKAVTAEYSIHVWPGLLYFSIHFACLKEGTNMTVNPRRPRLVIPLCIHPIRTSAVIRLPYVEKSWKSHVPSREMFFQTLTIIYRKTDIHCMKSIRIEASLQDRIRPELYPPVRIFWV